MESPDKAKRSRGYLGDGYDVESSVGHIRDLPTKAVRVPPKYKGEPWADSVSMSTTASSRYYFVVADKRQQMTELKKLLAGADELFLATDEDREGEAIAWHLFDVLKPKVPVTPHRLSRDHQRRDQRRDGEPARHRHGPGRRAGGTAHPRPHLRLRSLPGAVAQIGQGLSAGRVQSVALRLVVERERERIAFRLGVVLGLDGDAFGAQSDGRRLRGRARRRGRAKLATGKSFDDAGANHGPRRHRARSGEGPSACSCA